jgi:hypothetical protein
LCHADYAYRHQKLWAEVYPRTQLLDSARTISSDNWDKTRAVRRWIGTNPVHTRGGNCGHRDNMNDVVLKGIGAYTAATVLRVDGDDTAHEELSLGAEGRHGGGGG